MAIRSHETAIDAAREQVAVEIERIRPRRCLAVSRWTVCGACVLLSACVKARVADSTVLIVGGPLGEVGVAVQPMSDDGYLIAGYAYRDGSPDWASLLMHVDHKGQEQWRRLDDGPGLDFLWSLRKIPNAGFITAGVTSRDTAGGTDIILQRLGTDGESVWRKTFGGQLDDTAWAVRVLSDGGFAIAGQTESQGAGGLDFFLIRTDSNGNLLWSRTFGGPKTDRAFSIVETQDGGFVMAGMTGTERQMDMMLVRTDASGKELWTWTYGGDGFDVAHDVKRLPEGGYLAVGYTDSFGEGSHDACLAKVSERGRLLWMRTIGGTGDERILHAQRTDDGGHLLVGYGQNPDSMNWDLLVIAVDRDGRLLRKQYFGGEGQEQGKDIIRIDASRFVVVGGTQSFSEGPEDVMLIEIDLLANRGPCP